MTGLARSIAFLLGLAAIACTFLPWVLGLNAWQLALSSITSTGPHVAASPQTSLAVPVAVAALLVIIAALVNARPLLIVGALAAIGFPVTWVLVNAVDSHHGIKIAAVQIGAYATIIVGFLVLIVGALARDTSEPHVR